jgi:hypothetical protein
MSSIRSCGSFVFLGAALAVAGCQAPMSADPNGMTEGGDDSTADPMACGASQDAPPAYPPPGECYNNAGCATCNCLTWRDNPPDPTAVCAEPLSAGSLRITGTVLEFPRGPEIGGVTVEVFNAFDVGVMGIDNAIAVSSMTADAAGRIDLSVMPTDSIGMVAILREVGFRATATGLAKPPYEPSNAIHDLFVVPEALLVAYSEALATDPAMVDHLPLGEAGGVVGIARNRYTGEPVAGVEIVSLTHGAATGAIVRYLADDGSFTADATGPSGIYVVVNPALAEEFEAILDGAVVSTRANKAGSGAPGVFTMNLTVDLDPGADPFE